MELAQGERSTAEHEGRKSCTGGGVSNGRWVVFHRSQTMTLVNEFLNGNTLQGSAILLDEFHHLAHSFLVTAIVPGLA